MTGALQNARQESLDKPALMAGASGFVGSHITRLLVKRGRKVRVLLRKTSNTNALKNLPIEIFYGDAAEAAQGDSILVSLCSGMDNSKAGRDLNWNPRPITETVSDAVEWFTKRKKRLM